MARVFLVLVLFILILPEKSIAAENQVHRPGSVLNSLFQMLPVPPEIIDPPEPVAEDREDISPDSSPLPEASPAAPGAVVGSAAPEPSDTPRPEPGQTGNPLLPEIDPETTGNNSIEQPIRQSELLNENMVRDSVNLLPSPVPSVPETPDNIPEGFGAETAAVFNTQPTNNAYRFSQIRPPSIRDLLSPDERNQYYKNSGLPTDINLALLNLSALMTASGILFLRWQKFESQLIFLSEMLKKNKKAVAGTIGESIWKGTIYFNGKK